MLKNNNTNFVALMRQNEINLKNWPKCLIWPQNSTVVLQKGILGSFRPA